MRRVMTLPALGLLLVACAGGGGRPAADDGDRPYLLERLGDVAVARLYADGFERLPVRDQILCYHLANAAIAGRDIFLQQKCRWSLRIRDTLEEIWTHPAGVDPEALAHIETYLKRFWVDNGPYDAITSRKNVMGGTPQLLGAAARRSIRNGARLPVREGESAADLVAQLTPILFDPDFEPLVTTKNPEGGADILEASAMTFYGPGVTMAALEGFEEEYELNSTVVVGADGALTELPWRMGLPEEDIPAGRYAKEIAAIVGHLTQALPYAPEPTKKALEAQIRFYRTGKVEDRVAYDIAWVQDDASVVDTVNSFVEVYVDPRGKKGSWEAIVSYEDPNKAALIKSLAANAQWFEDHMPYADAYKKDDVKGISARSIDVLIETGDSGPVTPIGINLPNDQRVREEYGSKSVSLANVIEAYDKSTPKTSLAEFCWDAAEVRRAERWGALVGDLLTNMHEVIGHASGRQDPDHQGDPADWIKEYYSALEEGRSDLVGLYFMMDEKLEELGLLEDAEEAALAAYERYVRNGGLQQLRRIREGNQIEEDHMRNRQMVVRWIQANSDAIAERERGGKHYLVVTDAGAFREAAGRLLALVQEIKSTGDHGRAKALFQDHGVFFDPALRDEVLERYSHLDVPSYTGFVMPRLTAVKDSMGAVVDVVLDYPDSLGEQMLEWSGRR